MPDTVAQAPDRAGAHDDFTSAELGAIAHLYRGEVYRSTIWRTRLDATTNWSVVTLGVALSISFASADASPLPLLLAAAFITLFLFLEARRYRYFNVWRARARWIETHLYAPMLRRRSTGASVEQGGGAGWRETLAADYLHPEYHISFARALGRRLRRNYIWIFTIQAAAYVSKVLIHPGPAQSFGDFLDRMAIGPTTGASVFVCVLGFQLGWTALALHSWRQDRSKHGAGTSPAAMG